MEQTLLDKFKYRDKIEHFALGVLVIVCSLVGVYISMTFGFDWAMAYATTAVAILYEYQQKYRNEGQPSIADALATALPGWLFLLWNRLS